MDDREHWSGGLVQRVYKYRVRGEPFPHGAISSPPVSFRYTPVLSVGELSWMCSSYEYHRCPNWKERYSAAVDFFCSDAVEFRKKLLKTRDNQNPQAEEDDLEREVVRF